MSNLTPYSAYGAQGTNTPSGGGRPSLLDLFTAFSPMGMAQRIAGQFASNRLQDPSRLSAPLPVAAPVYAMERAFANAPRPRPNSSNLTPSNPYANVPRNPGRSNMPRKLPIADYVAKQPQEPGLPEIPQFDFGTAPGGASWDPYDKSIQDFMDPSRELYQGLLDAALSDIANRERNLKDQAAISDDNLRAIFGGYVENTLDQAGDISQQYDTASAEARTNADAAAASSQAAYNDSLAQQEAIRRSLGMEDVGFRDAENQQAQIMQQAVADANERALTQQNLMGENETAMLDWNTSLADAARAEGASQRSQLQRDLLSHLATLQDQSNLTKAQIENQIIGSAFDLFNMDYGQWRDNRDATISSAQDAYSRWAAEQQMKYQQFQDQRQYELGLQDRANEQARYLAEQLGQGQEFDINKERLDAQMQYLFQQSGFNPQATNTAIDVFQRSITNGGGDRDKTRFIRNVQNELSRLGWDENMIRSAIFRAQEYWDAYAGS